jgi:hypothetical protein
MGGIELKIFWIILKKSLTNFLKVVICSQCCSAQNANGEVSQQQEEVSTEFLVWLFHGFLLTA